MINILNRTDLSDGVSSSDSRIMRVWSVDWVKRELNKLAFYGVKTVKFSDELFFFDENVTTNSLMLSKKLIMTLIYGAMQELIRVRSKHLQSLSLQALIGCV